MRQERVLPAAESSPAPPPPPGPRLQGWLRGLPPGCPGCLGRPSEPLLVSLEHYLPREPEPYLAVYLHSVPQPNEHNCSASRRIGPEQLAGGDHRPYTFFIAPG